MRSRIETGAVPRDSWYGSSGTVSGHYMIVRGLDDGYSVNIVPDPTLWDWELRGDTWHPLTRCGSSPRPVCEIGRQVTCVLQKDALSPLGENPTPEAVARHALWLFPVLPRTVYWHPFISPAPNCPVLPYR